MGNQEIIETMEKVDKAHIRGTNETEKETVENLPEKEEVAPVEEHPLKSYSEVVGEIKEEFDGVYISKDEFEKNLQGYVKLTELYSHIDAYNIMKNKSKIIYDKDKMGKVSSPEKIETKAEDFFNRVSKLQDLSNKAFITE